MNSNSEENDDFDGKRESVTCIPGLRLIGMDFYICLVYFGRRGCPALNNGPKFL